MKSSRVSLLLESAKRIANFRKALPPAASLNPAGGGSSFERHASTSDPAASGATKYVGPGSEKNELSAVAERIQKDQAAGLYPPTEWPSDSATGQVATLNQRIIALEQENANLTAELEAVDASLNLAKPKLTSFQSLKTEIENETDSCKLWDLAERLESMLATGDAGRS